MNTFMTDASRMSSQQPMRHFCFERFDRRDETGLNVFCIAECEHAERFPKRFGGKFIDPKCHPKWRG